VEVVAVVVAVPSVDLATGTVQTASSYALRRRMYAQNVAHRKTVVGVDEDPAVTVTTVVVETVASVTAAPHPAEMIDVAAAETAVLIVAVTVVIVAAVTSMHATEEVDAMVDAMHLDVAEATADEMSC